MDVSGGLSLVQTILQVLGSPTWMKFEAVLSVKSRLNKLKDTMSTIEAVLLDAHEIEQLQQHRFTHIERDWLQRLKEALYQTDDLFDEIATLGHLKELMPRSNYKVCNEVRCFFSCSNQLCYAFKWSREMDNIMEMLDATVKDHRFDFGLRHPTGLGLKKERINARETYSYVCEGDVMIGREEDKRKVIDVMLLNTTVEQQDGFVVSIVGIGGLGKTTLARQVYNDEMIVEKFPRKLWVCVSDDFNVKALVGQILAAVNPLIKQDQMKLEELQTDLRKELDGKRYLLVLDDVWNEDSNKWLELSNVLIGDGRISGIVVTTRSKRVAEVVKSCYTHPLKGLSDDESWNLFQRMAFEPGQHPVKQQLVDIGKVIVRKCANVPLAIRVVGSLLRGQDESKWENLKNTDLANIVQDESNGIIPVLKISYNYLPFHLKSCFSYCAVFPKDYKIIKEDLICLWMAQGFIISSDGESFEDVGEEYFKQLLQRCFFQDVERAEDTEEIVSCKMHDLIHDLAKEVAGTDILSCTYRPRCFNEKTRHVYMDGSTPKDVVGKLSNMQRMRTFLCTKDRGFSLKPFVGGLSNVKYLRVLRLNDCSGLDKLPSGIGELVHLRYLDLSYNEDLCVLPSSITKLYNLQTLKLCDCKSLKRLPRELGKLVNLRHLDIDGCLSLTHMPPGMNSMTSLQKMTMFVVGGSATSNAAWSWRSTGGVGQLEDLDGFTNYTRTMHIIIKKNVRYNAVVGRGMLFKSQKLWEIKYKWETKENNNAEELLQGLQPCSKLRRLELFDYPGVRLPNWMMTFSCLKVLEFKGLSEVEYMENKSSNINSGHGDKLVFFPSLEKLKLEKMTKLKGWWKPSSSESGESDRIPQAPLLSELYVSHCPNLTTLFLGSSMNLKSCLPNLAKIEIRDCKRLEQLPLMSQLRHLKVLEYKGLSEVEYMESNINSGDDDELVFFPSLEKLTLENMAKLKGWWKPSSSESGESDRIPQAPLLSELYVSHCPNLTTLFVGSSMNSKSCLPNLVEIEIQKCEISGIVVTTRSKKVADVVESRWTHELKGLSDDESLDLFLKMALKPEEHPVKQQLVDIGKEIVRKCANVPLAIRVVGSLLRGQDESRWQYLEKTNLASVLQDESSGILPVLKISYYYLPFHLKSCFSYCAVFPKDYKFVKEDLICLWMAQGFIMPSDGKSLEDTGEEYFEQLLQRCFFQDIERSEGTNEIISFKMHDLIHDVASEVAGTEIVSSNCSPSCLNEKTRHISIDESSKLRTSDKMKRLRTFLFPDWSLRFWLKSSKKMKYLRVLRLNDSFLPTKLPDVGKLVHLRYLDLSHNRGLRVLPSSITNLYNLQTLKLYKCTSLESLPRDLRKLVNLRLLDIYGCSSLTCMPPGMNSMASLQNLTGFVVGGTSNAWYRGSAGVFKLEYLENLIRHSEILEVVVKKGVRYNGVEARKGGFLSESKKLRNIRYYWIDWSVSNDSDNAEALLQSLHPNSYLRKLELQGYPGVRLPSWTMNLNTSLPNLVEIVIHGCDMLEHIPLISQLRHLKVLELDVLYKVEYVESSNDSGGEDELVFFPSLEKLKLKLMPKLKGWWKSSSVSESEESETPQAPKLSHLEIDGCPELTTFPLCPGLQQLTLSDFNEALGPLIRETTQQKEEERHGRLREVKIDNSAYLNSLPIRSFHHISNLHINRDQKIEELKTGEVGEVFRSGRLSSLRFLVIRGCKKLKSISGRGVWDHFTDLESLTLELLPELELEDEDDVINNKSTEEGSDAEMPWRYLAPTLRSLYLWDLPKVVKLPKGIGCLSSLHSLHIWRCDNLESLTPSIGGLSSLHSLEILRCGKLKRMPEEMRHLTSLAKLYIVECSPELTKECKNKTGANWSNIQHIPNIKLDY